MESIGSLTHDSMVIYPAYLDGSMSGLWADRLAKEAAGQVTHGSRLPPDSN